MTDFKVQSVLFDNSKYTEETAKDWLLSHRMKVKKFDITENYIRCRQENPEKLKRQGYTIFRNKQITDDIIFVLAYKESIDGGAIAVKNLKQFVDESYNKNSKDKIDTYILDKSLSNEYAKVYYDPNQNHAVVVHRGTSGAKDWLNNVAYVMGQYNKTNRYKTGKEIQEKAVKKYGASNISTVGHSQGAVLAHKLGQDTKEVINLNPAFKGEKQGKNEYTVRSSSDVVSGVKGITGLLNPSTKKNEITINSKNPLNVLNEHSSNILDRLDQDKLVGGLLNISMNLKENVNKFYKVGELKKLLGELKPEMTKKEIRSMKKAQVVDYLVNNNLIQKKPVEKSLVLKKKFKVSDLKKEILEYAVSKKYSKDEIKNIKKLKKNELINLVQSLHLIEREPEDELQGMMGEDINRAKPKPKVDIEEQNIMKKMDEIFKELRKEGFIFRRMEGKSTKKEQSTQQSKLTRLINKVKALATTRPLQDYFNKGLKENLTEINDKPKEDEIERLNKKQKEDEIERLNKQEQEEQRKRNEEFDRLDKEKKKFREERFREEKLRKSREEGERERFEIEQEEQREKMKLEDSKITKEEVYIPILRRAVLQYLKDNKIKLKYNGNFDNIDLQELQALITKNKYDNKEIEKYLEKDIIERIEFIKIHGFEEIQPKKLEILNKILINLKKKEEPIDKISIYTSLLRKCIKTYLEKRNKKVKNLKDLDIGALKAIVAEGEFDEKEMTQCFINNLNEKIKVLEKDKTHPQALELMYEMYDSFVKSREQKEMMGEDVNRNQLSPEDQKEKKYMKLIEGQFKNNNPDFNEQKLKEYETELNNFVKVYGVDNYNVIKLMIIKDISENEAKKILNEKRGDKKYAILEPKVEKKVEKKVEPKVEPKVEEKIHPEEGVIPTSVKKEIEPETFKTLKEYGIGLPKAEKAPENIENNIIGIQKGIEDLRKLGEEKGAVVYDSGDIIGAVAYMAIIMKHEAKCAIIDDNLQQGIHIGLSKRAKDTQDTYKNAERLAKELLECIKRGEKIIVFPLLLPRHANIIVYRPHAKSIERIEPHGQKYMDGRNKEDDIVNEICKELFEVRMKPYLKEMTPIYYSPLDICPNPKGFQSLEGKLKGLPFEGGGFCVMWSLITMELMFVNPTLQSKDILQILFNLSKSDPKYLKDLIRGYVISIEKVLDNFLKTAGIDEGFKFGTQSKSSKALLSNKKKLLEFLNSMLLNIDPNKKIEKIEKTPIDELIEKIEKKLDNEQIGNMGKTLTGKSFPNNWDKQYRIFWFLTTLKTGKNRNITFDKVNKYMEDLNKNINTNINQDINDKLDELTRPQLNQILKDLASDNRGRDIAFPEDLDIDKIRKNIYLMALQNKYRMSIWKLRNFLENYHDLEQKKGGSFKMKNGIKICECKGETKCGGTKIQYI
jgi:hypothetical protein